MWQAESSDDSFMNCSIVYDNSSGFEHCSDFYFHVKYRETLYCAPLGSKIVCLGENLR